MTEIFTKAKTQAMLWRVSIIFCILYSLDAIATAFVSVMIDTQWSELDGTQKLIRVALISKAWASSMLAFFTNVGKKLESDEPLFTTRRTDTQVTQQTTEVQSEPSQPPK